jgi:hypothetical protein
MIEKARRDRGDWRKRGRRNEGGFKEMGGEVREFVQAMELCKKRMMENTGVLIIRMHRGEEVVKGQLRWWREGRGQRVPKRVRSVECI